jgi:protein SCO1/2
VVVFFGFTHARRVPHHWSSWPRSKLMGADGDKLHGVLSVDPSATLPEILKTHMGNLDPSYGPASTLTQLADIRDFKVFYKRVDGKTPGS